jgi:hypothetical protein
LVQSHQCEQLDALVDRGLVQVDAIVIRTRKTLDARAGSALEHDAK